MMAMAPSGQTRLRVILALGTLAYGFRAVNLWDNDGLAGSFLGADVWPYIYGVGALILGVCAWYGWQRPLLVLWSTITVVVISIARGWVIVEATGGTSSHVLVEYVFTASMAALTWPFMIHGRTLGRLEAENARLRQIAGEPSDGDED